MKRGPGWWWRLGAAALLVCGCARGGVAFVQATADAQGMSALVDRGGISRVMIERRADAPAWDALLLQNEGVAVVRDLRLWNGEGGGFLEAEPGDAPRPFQLLPGERLLLAPAAEGGAAGGSFLWEMPADPRALKASISRERGATLEAGTGLVLSPGNNEAMVEMTLGAPLEHAGARVGWRTDPPDAQVEVWVSKDARTWGKMSHLAAQDTWTQPVALDAAVAGAHEFHLRLTARRDDVPSGAGGKVRIANLRVEREVRGGARMREWRPGLNEGSLELRASEQPLLRLRLMRLGLD